MPSLLQFLQAEGDARCTELAALSQAAAIETIAAALQSAYVQNSVVHAVCECAVTVLAMSTVHPAYRRLFHGYFDILIHTLLTMHSFY